MEVAAAGTIGKALAEYGILGLGWVLFIMMLFREVRERGRYAELVIHIISYFTKVNMAKGQTDDIDDNDFPIPPELFDITGTGRRRRRQTRLGSRKADDAA